MMLWNVYNRRFIVLTKVNSSTPHLVCMNPGDFYYEIYSTRGWKELIKVNRPLTARLAQYVKKWVEEKHGGKK